MGVLERSLGFARLVYYVTDAPTAKESIQYIRILALQACHPSGVLPSVPGCVLGVGPDICPRTRSGGKTDGQSPGHVLGIVSGPTPRTHPGDYYIVRWSTGLLYQ